MSVESLEDFDRLVLDDEVEYESEIETSEEKTDEERAVELNALHNENNAGILKLPHEILSLILRWVVTSDLDVVSLSNCSLVCKEFFALSQESPLWHMMCQKLWGKAISRKPYPSWKMMYSTKPHIYFHGVYISRTSYIRMNGYSSPYCTVEYFRILRFLSNGEVLMLTTPKPPRDVVHKLEFKNRKVQGLLAGRYSICEDGSQSGTATLTADLKMCYTPKDGYRYSSARNRRGNNRVGPTLSSEYRIKMRLTSSSSKKKFNKLVWIKHTCCTKYVELGSENTCAFDISRQYPPLFFNHIKSYTAESYGPL